MARNGKLDPTIGRDDGKRMYTAVALPPFESTFW